MKKCIKYDIKFLMNSRSLYRRLQLRHRRSYTCRDFIMFSNDDLVAMTRARLKNETCTALLDPDGRFSWEGFKASISEGWNDNGLSGAVSGGLNNLGENFSNYFYGKGFNDNRELTRSLIFDGKHLLALDGYGMEVNNWSARSNTKAQNKWGGKTPEGTYLVSKLEKTAHLSMQTEKGFGYKAKLNYQGTTWPKNREIHTFFIHPDSGPLGTKGCIGIEVSQSVSFYKFLSEHLLLNKNIKVKVSY